MLAHLLIEKIEAYKPYVNHPNYDLVAINPRGDKLARISVKSRWATNRAGWFSLGSFDCHFVVHVALNRGVRRQKRLLDATVDRPVIYVFPITLCKKARSRTNKINIRKIVGYEQYRGNWQLISDFLK